MRLLAEIHRHAGVNPRGRAVTREAVRSVIWRGSELLLLYSRRDGTYKFPGGGVDAGESHVQALARELREECGAELIEVLGPLGRVVEYALPKETDFDVFCMTSYYYFCSIESELGAQDLKGYELDLGLEPRWLKAEEAIAVNEQALASGTAPSWTRRETTVLKLLRDRLQKTGS
ncbi:NUDIX hydrolase [Candidatus Darwinibacter acetoxidans]|jgi:8-oxo-dGTP diphosphatase|nr:NUDIX domain-containing protein [Candidatus Fermentithermobacillaceae bacterium]